MCPTCKTTLDQSTSPIADRIRRFISARISAGDTKSEIEQKLVAQFGPAVLAEPSEARLQPARLGAAVRGARPGGGRAERARVALDREPGGRLPHPVAAPIDPELERRLDEELARFDG